MKLLLDMGLAPRTASYLCGFGHDAVHLRDLAPTNLSDPDIIRLAYSEQRALVTFDLDFARIIALQRLASPSVILLRLERFTTDEVNLLLAELIAQYQSDLESGAILVVDAHRVRIRKLPIW